ncbi:uncharacterized protein LOC106883076 isoform X2 [Octopus bimaculoides]|uniref:uncharacterized protein LOC106883076 isoform X2 n=1 Tax=Octopus bimaculoides TaxID=37653 RepID=UPI00071E3EBB|nr:uncharacterized protein LOC106883076 isoform X2 [Octopus bimaculoides]|eukprot:XP_014789440.1 PREDICTED: uncharacterized protein LOC106883076 isoform X2 [Octopus bimaculoides]
MFFSSVILILPENLIPFTSLSLIHNFTAQTMPIFYLPVVNKFGILSEQQRRNVNKRLQTKQHSNTNDSRPSFSSNRSPLQVTEEFVENYNKVKNLEEQKKYHAKAVQMLLRIKWNAGLSSSGFRKDANVSLAWSELILLLKCKGDIQQECLDLLLMSLKLVAVDCNHVPLLLLLADTLLSLLSTHFTQQSFLRETHMKQLKVCQLVFMRLYCHKMANHLDGWQEVKKRLHSYFASFSDSASFYTKHPDAQLLFRFIIQVADIILIDDDLENDTNYEFFSHNFKTDLLPPVLLSKVQSESPPAEISCPSRHSSWVSKSMHELSAPLWHALNVWKYQTLCSGDGMVREPTNKKELYFVDSLSSLIQCTFNLDTASCWVDYVVALNVLAEAAKRNFTVLSILQYLAYCSICNNDWQNTRREDVSQRHPAGFEDKNQVKTKEPKETENDFKHISHGTSQNCFHKRSDIFGDSKESDNKMSAETEEYSFGFWPWDIIFIYTELLGDVLLNGSTSHIQKRALMGDNCKLMEESCYKRQQQFQLKSDLNFQIDTIHNLCSVSLLELTHFKSPHEISMESANEDNWNWRIRLGAIQALMRVYHCLLGEPTREVLLTTLWTILLQFYSSKKTAMSFRQTSLHNFMSHMADNLVEIYLLESCGSKEQLKEQEQHQQRRQQQQQLQQQQQQITNRNSLTQKLNENKSIIDERKSSFPLRRKNVQTRCFQSYRTRTFLNLQEVIRNQWNKENPGDLWEDLQHV